MTVPSAEFPWALAVEKTDFPVAEPTRIRIGDLCWYDGDNVSSSTAGTVLPASALLAANQASFARNFVGVALSAHRPGDATVTQVTIGTRGVFRMRLFEALNAGDIVGVAPEGARLSNRQVTSGIVDPEFRGIGVAVARIPTEGSFGLPYDGLIEIFSGGLRRTRPLPTDALTLQNLSTFGLAGIFGEFVAFRCKTDFVAIAAAATTTLTGFIEDDSAVFSVSTRVVTAIPTAATYSVGVTGATARYGGGISTAAGTTSKGMGDEVRFYNNLTDLIITPNLTPAAGTGRLRVSVFYYTISPADR